MWDRSGRDMLCFNLQDLPEIRVIKITMICFVIGLAATVLLVVIRSVQSESDLT